MVEERLLQNTFCFYFYKFLIIFDSFGYKIKRRVHFFGATTLLKNMVCFCFLVDQTKKVKRSKPVAGSCSRCGGGASVADMITQTRFCFVPFYWKSWKAIMCTFCGAMLKSYRWQITCKQGFKLHSRLIRFLCISWYRKKLQINITYAAIIAIVF